MQTLTELIEKQTALERQISAARNAARSEALAEIRNLMMAHGLMAADLNASLKVKTAGTGGGSRGKVAPKYREPATGATWTGRGLKPKWLAEHLAAGKQISDFAI
jgi:DNA-binding protein H-NS